MRRSITQASLLAVVGMLASSGCGGDPARLPVFPTEGTVLSQGKPAANAVILFHPTTPNVTPQDGAEISSIVTEADADGHYRLSTYMADDGAPAGEYVVTVRPGGAPEIEGSDGLRAAPKAPDSLAKYARANTSPLKATIKPGDNRFDFDLK